MLKYKIMFQIFFVSKYFWVLAAVIFGTLLPDHPVFDLTVYLTWMYIWPDCLFYQDSISILGLAV